MKKYKNLFLTLILFFLVLVVSATSVIYSEYVKKKAKIELDKAYYRDQLSSWKAYQSSYIEEIQKVRDLNISSMKETQTAYQNLLVEQPKLIKEHTAFAVNNSVQNTSITNPTTETKKVLVRKPVSKPQTRSS